MNQELRLLEEILKRNSEDPDSIDIENEVDHYFFFDGIKNEEDLDEAWRVFDEHEEIRNRLLNIVSETDSISRWGYCSGQLILATVLESLYLISDSFGAKPAL
ncbi:hypothetical protein H5201_22225 [Pseudoalteromonas sp. SG43-6]|uniref:hypothetical protein n=1 Tax=Pseudoalteromonas sp. SG43-6 TaxID=2760967 RepID=UPI001601F162|nr:hypothetical protein [Pseudoalteromonas sp. SG43-6]MBB1436959.1 hypothetical protein [Pseudoalteromonas sp. SG43-6]